MTTGSLPDVPEWFSPTQRARWTDLTQRVTVTPVNAPIIAAWILAEEQYRQAAEQQSRLDAGSPLPLLTKGRAGAIVASPYLGVMTRATTQMTRLAKSLGLDQAGDWTNLRPEPGENADAAGDPAPPTCNKSELARLLGVSLNTVAAHLDRYPDFPVVKTGTNGREWRFDPVAVRDFMLQKQEEERRAEADRAAAIGQLGLPIEETPDDVGMSARQRLDHVRAMTAEDKLRIERGYLVSVPAERQHLTSAIARWSRSLRNAVSQAATDFNLPAAVRRALTDRLHEAQRQFVADLQLDAGSAGDGGENDRSAA